MRTIRTAILILLAGAAAWNAYPQQAVSVIPYRMTGGKMIVDFWVGDRLIPFVFDTGGRTAIWWYRPYGAA